MIQDVNPPSGFILDEFQRDFHFKNNQLSLIWKKLQRRETFTQGQIFPYRVEFSSQSQEGEFLPGELNIHHGPWLSVHGAIGEISDNYRNLNYFYGSYVISFRLVRPIQLEFFRKGDQLTLKLKVYLRPWFKPFWHLLNSIFWMGFRFTI